MSREIQRRCSRYIPSTFFFPDSVIKSEGKELLEHCLNTSYWSSPSINECWRFVRCEPGASLGLHFDGKYVPNVDYCSIFTIMVYLSDNEDGALKFSGEENASFLPREGRVVIFDQKLLHEGCTNSKMKYYARSEIMYSRSSKIETSDDAEAASLYREACRLHSADPTSSRAKLLEEKSFTLSPLLEKLILNY